MLFTFATSQATTNLPKQISQAFLAFIIWTGIINIVVALLKPFADRVMTVMGHFKRMHNHLVVDASGKTIRVVKLDGKIYPPFGEEKIREVARLSMRKDDVLLCGYPKTGCHWMYEIIYMLLNGNPQLSRHGKELGGFIEVIPELMLDSLPSPRILNSHLWYGELPREIQKMKTKIILTVRNPKDTVVSFYNHQIALKNVYGYDGCFDDYFKLFMDGNLEYGDYFDYTLDWERAMRNQRHNDILMVSFEEMKSDPLKCVYTVAKFLDIPISQKFAQEIVEGCSFSKLKHKRRRDGPAAKLFRKGGCRA
ncbi:sulfotransferase 1c4 [Plakobranchus ocellatus]|uniref:Sulfotransferase 1c4 n=1 Tax=Plakobranchus ocellatus TaxID=259542 RepID=A0AAV4C7K1_9GAST|nr:sulfotransferase 1c4 [Plakobranchus ocellatus]